MAPVLIESGRRMLSRRPTGGATGRLATGTMGATGATIGATGATCLDSVGADGSPDVEGSVLVGGASAPAAPRRRGGAFGFIADFGGIVMD